MEHPFKKITGVWGRWRTHLPLVVYEDQRMISWSPSTYVGSRDGTQIIGLA